MLTFTNITALKTVEDKINNLIDYSKKVGDMMPMPALLLKSEQEIVTANQHFKDYFRFEENELNGINFNQLLHDFWKTTALDKLTKTDKEGKSTIQLEQDFPKTGKKRLVFTSISSVYKHSSETLQVLIVVEETGQDNSV